jgi:adenine C2-methylase RlmN of 23S rRNA A2503 and tRNA A37
MNINEIQESLEVNGYDHAVAIATKAEVEAGAACGQLAIIVESDNDSAN